MNIHPEVIELFYVDTRMEGRTDGRTDRHDEANSLFRNFSNAPKNHNHLLNLLLHG